MKKFLLLSAALTFCAMHAQAQEETPEFFKKYVTENSDYKDTIRIKSQSMFRYSFPDCAGKIELSMPTESILLKPIEVRVSENFTMTQTNEDEDKNTEESDLSPDSEQSPQTSHNITHEQPKPPIYGQWITHVLTKGCGQSVIINHLAVAYKNNPPVFLPVINGKTILDPIDQPFAESAIAERLKKLERPCDLPAIIKNSDFLGYRSKDGASLSTENTGYGWFEKWSLRACDVNYNANIAILPDPKTRYTYLARLQKQP